MTNPLLQFSQISKQFDDQQVLNKINLSLEPGMVLGLLGRNGAGKSTLLRIALGLIEPSEGEVSCLGVNSQTLSPQLKAKIGYVPQQPCGYQGFKVVDALQLHRSFYNDWDKQLEQQWLTRFALDGNALVSNLSVGQQQSLALIMAMAYRPQLLVLDEPVSSLDPIARREFMGDVFDLALESGSGVIFSTHITSDVERIASHIAIIKDGSIVINGELDSVKEQVKLLPKDYDAALPEGKYIHHGEQFSIYQASLDADWGSLTGQYSSNLEQLFVELHG